MDLAYRAGAQAYQETGLAFGASRMELSWLGAISAFCYSGMCLLAGVISDRVGRKASTLLACVGLALGYVLAGVVSGIHLLMALTILSGSALAYFWPAVQAWIADLSGPGRQALARRLGLFNVSWAAGLAVGPTFTGLLWRHALRAGLSQLAVFWSVAGLVLLLGGLMLLIRSRALHPEADPNGEEEERAHPHAASLLFGARAGTFASWFAVGAIGSLFPKLADTLDFGPATRGMLASCYHVGQVALFVVALYGTRWLFRRWSLALAETLALIGMVSVVWAHRPAHFAVAFLLAGMCSGVAYTGSLFYSLHGRVEDRGRLAGIHEAVLACGVFLSPLVGGFLAQYVSLRAPFVMVGVVFAAAIGAQTYVWTASKRAYRLASPSA